MAAVGGRLMRALAVEGTVALQHGSRQSLSAALPASITRS
jgi:hypothetical protein